MIRFSKLLWLNPAKIWVSGIRCSFNNIVQITNVFDCKWVVVTMEPIKKESSLLTLIKKQGLKYFVKPCSAEYVEITAVIPYTRFEDFLDKAIQEDPENIFVYNLLIPEKSDMCLQCSIEELLTTGIINAFMSISFDENALLICMNKNLLPTREVYKKIKALRLD